MTPLKTLGVLALIVLAGFAVVAKYSVVATVYECSGTLAPDGDHTWLAEMFVKHNRYRWWVHLWSNSDGEITAEVLHGMRAYYSEVEEFGDSINIAQDGTRMGVLSRLSMGIDLKTPEGLFTGTCKQVERSL